MVVFDLDLGLASNIRITVCERLSRNISLAKIQDNLLKLFVDRINVDSSSLGRFVDVEFEDRIYLDGDDINDDKITILDYNDCLCLNDESTIEFNQKFKQADDVFDEKRQIWIDRFVDTEKNDLFIPRDDGNG